MTLTSILLNVLFISFFNSIKYLQNDQDKKWIDEKKKTIRIFIKKKNENYFEMICTLITFLGENIFF
jgi:hypothetical protein